MTFQAHACRFLLALVFILAAIAKAYSPSQGLAMLGKLRGSRVWHPWALAGLIALECELGFRLLLSSPDAITLGLCAFMFLSFMTYLAWLHREGHRESCSCYGAWLKLSPIEAIKLDCFYLVALAVLYHGIKQELPLWSEHSPFGASILLITICLIRLKS